MNFFKQLQTLAKAKSHDILDKEVNLNSPSMLREYARELEDEVENLNNEAGNAAGSLRTAQHELQRIMDAINLDLANGKKAKEANVPGLQEYLEKKAAEIVNLRQQAALKQQEIDADTAASAQLDSVVGKIKAKSQEINARIRSLESEDASGKAKLHAATVISHTAALLNNAGSTSIDDIESKIHAANDQADVKLERAMGDFNNSAPDNAIDCIAVKDVMSEF